MIHSVTTVRVKGISGRDISNFLLNCTDAAYRKWWPGTHLTFHTVKRLPNDIGSLVYFDEYVGGRRLKSKGIVVRNIPGREIVWQMKKLVKLPVRLALTFEDNQGGVKIVHSLAVGFNGTGKVLDPLLKLYFTDDFKKQLEEHARMEFIKLGQMLHRYPSFDPRQDNSNVRQGEMYGEKC